MTQEDIIRAVIEEVPPLTHPLDGRIPIRGSRLEAWLPEDDQEALGILRGLDARGIGMSPRWNPGRQEQSLEFALRLGRLQKQLGLAISVNANACMHSFFNGDESTFHVAEDGTKFFDESFGRRKMGCPFAVEQRKEEVKQQFVDFLEAYQEAGLTLDFLYLDWEIDGPIEWNGAWESSKKCTRCREHIPNIEDFGEFQTALREIRSSLQRDCCVEVVQRYFPDALIGNYSVYPQSGQRYWYDYYEELPEGAPFEADQLAKYRPWFHEFEPSGYTFANPVCYTWYATYGWYPEFDNDDYRWFYNMLLVGSNAGKSTPQETPLITWVHWHTTAPPADAPAVPQFSEEMYQEFLWHLFLRGTDGLMMWCTAEETVEEVRLMQEVVDGALAYREFLDDGEPVLFDLPTRPGTVVSGLKLGDRLLVRRTEFGDSTAPVTRQVGDVEVEIARLDGQCQIIQLPAE